MKRAWIALVALAVFAAVPASAAAKHQKPAVKNAAKYCKAQRAEMGADAFRAAYDGKRNAFGKCVKKRVHDLNALRREAIRQCKAELGVQSHRLRHEGGPGERPGANAPGRAFRKCVFDKTNQQDQSDQEDFISAVRTCLAEHDADPAAFNDEYSDDGNAKEAFVHCVRQQFEQNQGEDDSQPGDEPGDDSGEDTPATPPTDE
jgi:hypothetical protein